MLPLYSFDYDDVISDSYQSVRIFIDDEE